MTETIVLKEKVHKLGLIKGRHDLPVDAYILEEVSEVLDFQEIESKVKKSLDAYTEKMLVDSFPHLYVYVTGLTSATIEVFKYCLEQGVLLTFMHFDRESGSYLPQKAVGIKEVEKAIEFDSYKTSAFYLDGSDVDYILEGEK